MAQERVSMRKIKEILRLKYEKGLSNRQTAISAGVSRGFKIFRACAVSGYRLDNRQRLKRNRT